MNTTVEEQTVAMLGSGDAEMARAWATFTDPVQRNQDECWQYMGTELLATGWAHCFRHRCHPADGQRRYVKVPAPVGWVPPSAPRGWDQVEGGVVAEPAAEYATVPTSSPNRPNRYSGTCAACGGGVPARGGSITKRGGQWVVHHNACIGKAASVPQCGPARVTTVRTSSGWTGTRNRRGVCEDAPACGCCTF